MHDSEPKQRKRALSMFLAITALLAVAIPAIQDQWFGRSQLSEGVFSLLYMWGPGLSALITIRFALKARMAWLGPWFSWNWSLTYALLIPLAVVISYQLLSAAGPGATLNASDETLREAILASVPAAQRDAVTQQMVPLGDWLVWIVLAQVLVGGIITGLTVTSIAALGEELAWRGFLSRLFNGSSFWVRSAQIGIIWGVWHVPMILRGHNLPGSPVLGCALMILFCLLWAPLFQFVRERNGGLWAAVAMHGVLNALATGAAVFVSGGAAWWVGPIGVSVLLILAASNLVLYLATSAMPRGRD